MKQQQMIEETRKLMRSELADDATGHDYYHIERVHRLAKYIAQQEGGDAFVVEMAALLHDWEDWKHCKDCKRSKTKKYLKSLELEKPTRKHILSIIETMSFQGGLVDSSQATIEGQIVQDCDRLDALGAIGIARAFAYGGAKSHLLYDPFLLVQEAKTLEELQHRKQHTIHHFYEKLLKLNDLLYTESAKKIAVRRHRYLQTYLDEFYHEWYFEAEDLDDNHR
ncbi:MAG: HD domain-containing protein [Erysipelotrichaceae bacterium]